MNCLIINSNIQEIDLHTNEELDALIEINLPTEDMIYLLKSIYKEWKEIKVEIKELAYDIVRNNRNIQLKNKCYYVCSSEIIIIKDMIISLRFILLHEIYNFKYL